MSVTLDKAAATATVILTGNPNCGKTTVFNALTGLRAKVGNYAGVTVERKEGRLLGTSKDRIINVLDLPGCYSLSPQSIDEEVARDVLFHHIPDVPVPDVVVVVVDASNLARNLFYATQVLELGYLSIVALNMVDVAQAQGHTIDSPKLSSLLGVPVVPLVASTSQGVDELRSEILRATAQPQIRSGPSSRRIYSDLPPSLLTELRQLESLVHKAEPSSVVSPLAKALLFLGDDRVQRNNHLPGDLLHAVQQSRRRLEAQNVSWQSLPIELRYARIASIQNSVLHQQELAGEPFSDRLDRLLTHKFWGVLIFLGLMGITFQAIFTLAQLPMEAIENGITWLGQWVDRWLQPGDLHSLLVDGVLAGVGAVVVFLPQIALLFLFLGLLEDTGYMARAAFLMDRFMSKVGLHGKSFIPLLSSFACAIPGIMATRTIENQKDRLATILVAPLMSCSARLPVYALLIAACIPDRPVLGFIRLPGLTLFSMYLLGILVALLMAWIFKKTLLKGEPPLLILELPTYKRPALRTVALQIWERSIIFLKRAGTVILGINILLWFFATYPRSSGLQARFDAQRQNVHQTVAQPEAKKSALAAIDLQEASEKLAYSFAGRLGHLIEPIIAPLGFDWKIGIGIVASFAAREVFVSTMSTVYNFGQDTPGDDSTQGLAQTFREQRRPDGSPVYSTLTGVTLMIFYVFALQCVSTVAIVRRETNSWKWPVFQWAYMGFLAWILAFLTYHGGRLLGWG